MSSLHDYLMKYTIVLALQLLLLKTIYVTTKSPLFFFLIQVFKSKVFHTIRNLVKSLNLCL